MVKIFIGNLACDTAPEDLRQLFEKYGKVSESDVVKNYGFVHMNDVSEAEEAIRNLHQHELNGWRINVEMSKGRPKSTTKLHVSNLGEGVTTDVLRARFAEFGTVVECDIVKDYAFIHMDRMEDAMDAIGKLDNTAYKGKLMSVQLSTSRLRTNPGMGEHTGCFVCGKHGHWSRDCPVGPGNGGHGDGDGTRGGGGHGYGWGGGGFEMEPPAADFTGGSAYSRPGYGGGVPPSPRGLSGYGAEPGDRYSGRGAGGFAERSPAYDRERLFCGDYRARPYDSSYFEDRRMSFLPSPPPPPSSLSTLSSSIDPYDRRAMPPSSSSAAAAAAAAFYARGRSPIRRVPGYEQTQLSPAPGSQSSYAVAPRPKDHYTARYEPY